MKLSKTTVFLLAALCLLGLLTGCTGKEKYVGSTDTPNYSCNIEIYKSLGQLADDSECIIMGKINEKPTEVTETFDDEILYASKYKIEIVETLKGDISDPSIDVLQTGKPDSDQFETKLKEQHAYILFLNSKTFNGETVYDCAGIEQGIFEIQEDGQLYAYSDMGISLDYDRQSKNRLLSEIKSNLNKQGRSPLRHGPHHTRCAVKEVAVALCAKDCLCAYCKNYSFICYPNRFCAKIKFI